MPFELPLNLEDATMLKEALVDNLDMAEMHLAIGVAILHGEKAYGIGVHVTSLEVDMGVVREKVTALLPEEVLPALRLEQTGPIRPRA